MTDFKALREKLEQLIRQQPLDLDGHDSDCRLRDDSPRCSCGLAEYRIALDLLRQLAESEAKVKALGAKLGEAHGSCEWKLDDWDGSWDASCGLKWIFDESGNLADHEMNFCPKCGRKIDQEARKKGAEHE